MTRTNGRAFNEWLRAQLKAKKMSQRQLAQQSGVDHSTISRLVRGDRMPSLGTATKLARGLRELGENDDGPQYLGLMGGGVQNPTARVEYSLRADEALSEAQVRQIMEYYLAIRMRRLGGSFNDTGHSSAPRSAGRDARQPCPRRERPDRASPGARLQQRPRGHRIPPFGVAPTAPGPLVRQLLINLESTRRGWPPRPRPMGQTNAGARGAGVRHCWRPSG